MRPWAWLGLAGATAAIAFAIAAVTDWRRRRAMARAYERYREADDEEDAGLPPDWPDTPSPG